MVGYGGKDLQKRKVLSLEWKSKGVMDGESGESMELMEEVPLEELGEAELERLFRWIKLIEPCVIITEYETNSCPALLWLSGYICSAAAAAVMMMIMMTTMTNCDTWNNIL